MPVVRCRPAGCEAMPDPPSWVTRAGGGAGAMRKPRVIVTSGDPGGVGPELILRALADPEVGGLADFTVVGSPASFRRDAKALGLPMPTILPAGDSPGVPARDPLGVPASGPPGVPASGPSGVPASGPSGV